MSSDIRLILTELLQRHSTDEIIDAVNAMRESSRPTLTIIVDNSLHSIPETLVVGEKFVMSSGALNATTDENLQADVLDRLQRLGKKLKERDWQKVRLVLSGHCLLSVQAKMLVYRITHLETEDIAYFSDHGYRKFTVSLRDELSKP
jgi:hypothetical protein